MRVEVETTSAGSQTSALGAAGTATLTVDLPPELGGTGRGFTGEQLLCLSLAGSVSNALHQEARATRTELTHVSVRVRADFPDGGPNGGPDGGLSDGADGGPDRTALPAFEYDVELAGNARIDRLEALIAYADRTAPVAVFLRRTSDVRLAGATTRSDFPRRTLEEALAVCRFMERWAGTWWVAGGWALDFWLGFATREHEDIELAVPRADQAALKGLVADWQSVTPKDNRWAPMAPDELLQPPASMWQLRRTPATGDTVENMPPRWEFVLTDVEKGKEGEEGEWVFPHDPTLRLPLARVIVASPLGPPVAAPEIVLLLKAFHNPPRPKDKHDLLFARERFTQEQRTWLREHIERFFPEHRWLPLLS